jgi:hypothetical protein
MWGAYWFGCGFAAAMLGRWMNRQVDVWADARAVVAEAEALTRSRSGNGGTR